jgi:purine-binding chemotaxis protein CheW
MSNLQATNQKQIVVFTLDEPRYALYLSAVERVVRGAEITPLPKAPEVVLGVINVQGEIILVMDIRKRLHLPARELDLGDQFILVRTARRRVALLVDSVVGCRQVRDREQVPAGNVLPGAEYIHGLAKLEGNLILICDVDQFLSLDEERKLEAALAGNVTKTGRKTRRKTGEAV